MTPSPRDQEIIAINQSMLESVVNGNWEEYSQYCDDDLSCFENETNGILVEGLPFHRFYFQSPTAQDASPSSSVITTQVTMARPHLRWLGEDFVILSYTRLTQRQDRESAITTSCCETRVWARQSDQWKQVHVHRS